MSAFDDLLQRLTHRLRIDPELQREISAELRTHLEASTREFLAAGMGDDEARAAAVKALGNEAEVAEQLWEANWRRMRLRKAAKWAIGMVVGPAAVVASVAVAWGPIVSLALLLAMFGSLPSGLAVVGNGDFVRGLQRYAQNQRLASLTPADRLAFPADDETLEARIDRARKLAEMHPGEPMYWANYAMQSLMRRGVHGDTAQTRAAETKPAPAMQQVLEILDRGKHLEPGNAFYPWMKATILLSHATRPAPPGPEGSVPGFDYLDMSGKSCRFDADRYEVLDKKMFAHGLDELKEAAGKPYADSYAAQFAARYLDLFPPETRLSDHLLRLQLEMSVLLPHLNAYRWATNLAIDEVLREAEAGHGDEAMQLLQDVRKLSLLAARSSRFVVELLVDNGIYSSTLEQEVLVQKASGSETRATEAIRRLEAHQKSFRMLADRPLQEVATRQWQREAGMTDRLVAHYATDPSRVNPAPGRRAEYAVLDQLALAVILLVLLVAVTLRALRAVLVRLHSGRWPGVALMGWRVLVKVVAVSVVLPLVAYAFYAYLTPLGGRRYGTFASLERIAVEYATLASAVFVLLRWQGCVAMKRRAAELGVKELVPPRVSRVTVAIGAPLAVAAIAYIAVWHKLAHGNTGRELPTRGAGFVLAAIVAMYGLSCILNGAESGDAGNRRVRRLLVGVLLGAIVAGAIGSFWIVAILRPSPQVDELVAGAGAAVGAAAMLSAVGVYVWRRWRRREGAGGPRFGYGLSVAPAMLASAVVLVLLWGIPLRLLERRDVEALAAPGGGPSFVREVDQSYWRILRDQLADAESGAHEAPAQLPENH